MDIFEFFLLIFFSKSLYTFFPYQIFQHSRSRRGYGGASSVVATTQNGKYTPLHVNDMNSSNSNNMLRLGAVKNSRNSTTREMFLALDDKMSVSKKYISKEVVFLKTHKHVIVIC